MQRGMVKLLATLGALPRFFFAKTRESGRFRSCGITLNARSRVIVLLMACVLTPSLFGQAKPEQTTLPNMFHKSWTVREGAPGNITTLRVGSDGFIWLGTDDGLYRFDGVSFSRVPLPSYVKQQAISSMLQTEDRTLWLGLTLGGIVRIHGNDVRFFTGKDGLRPSYIDSMESVGTDLWFCTSYGPASISQDKVRYYSQTDGITPHSCDEVYQDTAGNMWVKSHFTMNVRLRGEQQFTLSKSWTTKTSCAASRIEGVWCSRSDGEMEHLSISDRSIKTNISPGPTGTMGLSIPPDGYIYVYTYEHGFSRVQEAAALAGQAIAPGWDTFDVVNGLSASYVFDVWSDAEGSIWTATVNGIDQLRPRKFRPLAVHLNDIPTLLSGKRGAQNLVADKRIIDIDNENVILPELKRAPRNLYRSEDESLWFDTPNGLGHLKDGKTLTTPFPISQTGDGVLGITEDDSKHIFIAPIQSSAYGLVDGQWVKASVYGLPSERVFTTYHEPSGGAWFGYIDGSAAKLSHGHAALFNVRDGLDLGMVLVFAQVEKALLAGGSSGAAFLKNGHFYPVRLRDGTALRGVTGITLSPSGSLWFNTSGGVFEVPGADFRAALEDPSRTVSFERYGAQDGVDGSTNPLAARGSAWIGPNGLLYIVTRTHFQVADPNSRSVNSVVPQVFVLAASDGANTVRESGPKFVSSKNPLTVAFTYAATSLLDPDKVLFRYRLEGYDKDWQDAGTRRQASYSHLPPGHYTFHVTACNNSGLWNNVGATMSLEVPATFQQTLSFKMLLAALAVCLLTGSFRLRLESAKKLMRDRAQARANERERIARDLHDSFFPGVEALLLHVHAAISKLPKGSEVRLVVNEAFQQADTVMSYGRSLIYDLRQDKPEELLESAIRGFANSISVDAVPCIEIARSGNTRRLEPLAVMEILSITKEALWNALRHAASTSIRITVDQRDRMLVVCVSDDGTGIGPEIAELGHRHGHFGLQGMRERALKLKGSLEISILPSGGTKVLLQVPAAIAYVSKIDELWTRLFNFNPTGDRKKA